MIEVLHQDHRSCEKNGENMASRKLNVLLHPFTGKAEFLQSVDQGSASHRKVIQC